jgi:uncharacterized protein YbaA (DUF1428 family)
MTYIEGFILAVPEKNKEAYREHAASAAPYFKESGVTRMVETWADDVPDGKVTDFRRAVKAQPDEAVLFSWLEYPNREVRDAAVKKFMSDPKLKEMSASLPFDGQRMIWGGFKSISDSGRATKPGYVDGSVVPVPAGNEDAYRELATRAAAIFLEYGATRVVDAWADDVPDGKVTDFKGAVNKKDDERVVYSWIEWPSKEVRDAAWPRVMADARFKDHAMPFDGQRLIYGGFRPILDA